MVLRSTRGVGVEKYWWPMKTKIRWVTKPHEMLKQLLLGASISISLAPSKS